MTQQSPFHLETFGATHLGGNTRNEDHFRVDEKIGLFAVADGVASLPAPAVAAEAAVNALFNHVTDPNLTPPADARQRMERTLAHVNRRVREQAAADGQLQGMAASLACAMDRGRLLVVGHVGECRVARIRDGQLERLTADHRRGTDPLVLSRLAARPGTDRGAVTRAIGLGESLAPSVCVEAVRGGDGVLLATAGLWATLKDHEIVATVLRCQHPRAVVNALISGALARGAADSLTCVYAHWRALGG